MMEASSRGIGVLVADSGAFIRGAPLQQWSSKVTTVREVVSEIRDKATRERLQVLPYELVFREPSVKALQHVTQFAKKTGDYGSLSPVDLKLVALTFQLHCELEPATATAQLRNDPPKEEAMKEGAGGPNMVGFYVPRKEIQKPEKNLANSITPLSNGSQCPDVSSDLQGKGAASAPENGQLGGGMETLSLDEESCEQQQKLEGGEEEEEEDEEEEDEVDSDNEGWITPENFRQTCEEMGGVLEKLPMSLAVGCITTDFAMQNVLLQMGLNLISVDGMRIRQLRTYAKKCKGCFKTTTNTALVWCPGCGNRSLFKVSVVVDGRGGSVQYRPLGNKQFSHKGLRHPLPIPKSGRHAHNPVLSPDQQVTYKERRRRENKLDPLDRDYVAQSSPFALHDVTSRGVRLGVAGGRGGGQQRRNPNAVRPKGRRRK